MAGEMPEPAAIVPAAMLGGPRTADPQKRSLYSEKEKLQAEAGDGQNINPFGANGANRGVKTASIFPERDVKFSRLPKRRWRSLSGYPDSLQKFVERSTPGSHRVL